ncbi:hypothetical protein BVX98_06960 [bacterium F11]|nr:hypothetical protein BVX98_06960 [bacterium F11]
MTTMRFSTSDIFDDFCINCYGVWLERGELQGIILHIWGSAFQISLEDMSQTTIKKFLEVFHGKKKFADSVKEFLAAWHFLTLKLAASKPDLVKELNAISRSLPF